MRIIDLIEDKKRGKKHSEEDIEFIINAMMKGGIEDYQISAWLMAVYFQGLDIEETTYLTRALVESGEILDLSMISDNIVDKHSTGGVGDKITIILIPILMALGIPTVKLSGRGLGYTGGTIDKLEAIPNFNCALKINEIISQVKTTGAAIASQTANLTPADGKLYALRDVTATVDSMPLIAASVVSKKIASGANHIILDVKYGSGAFIKTPQEAKTLSGIMSEVGKRLGRNISAVVSSMEEPLGRAVGNSIEVIETIEFLKGNKVRDLEELTYKIAAIALLKLNMAADETQALKMVEQVIKDGSALNCLKILIEKQGGNFDVIEDYRVFAQAGKKIEIKAGKEGFVEKIDALKIAKAAKSLGAGRERKTDTIDHSVGVYLNKKTGEFVKTGEVLATIFANAEKNLDEAKELVKEAYKFSNSQITPQSLIYKVIF